MDKQSIQKRLGIYFAGINVISLAVAALTTVLTGLREGLIAFFASIIILTVLIQGYAQRKLEENED